MALTLHCLAFRNSTPQVLQRNDRAGNGGGGKRAQWGDGKLFITERDWVCGIKEPPPHLLAS